MARAKTTKEKKGKVPAVRFSSRNKEQESISASSSTNNVISSPPEEDKPREDECEEEKSTNKDLPKRTGEINTLKCLDLLQYGWKRDRCLHLNTVRDHMVNKSIKGLDAADYAGRFTRRITALAWHEKYPYILASASKFGDIMLISGIPLEGASPYETSVNFVTKAEIQGGGAGYSITGMKFHDQNMNLLYRCSIDCTVASVDLERADTNIFFETGDYNRWFCGLDVSCPKNLVIAGDNKGTAYSFSLDGKLASTWRLHKTKIHHCEFSKKDLNLLVTASLDKAEAVRIWDVRCMRTSKDGESKLTPIKSLAHKAGLNCARFSLVDGSKLLTSDQMDEIRIYQGPLWKDYITIKHHHKQFQHITPIKADWHPVNDYIVIGRYPPPGPRNEAASKKHRAPRAIEFFDSSSGKLVDVIYPPLDEICSLNVFNPTGEYLATGMNSKLLLWKPNFSSNDLLSSKLTTEKSSKYKVTVSEATRNILRGRRAREYSPASGDDDEEETTSKKKRSRTTAATTNSTQKAVKEPEPSRSKTVSKKKK